MSVIPSNLDDALRQEIEKYAQLSPCGSRVTCDPPPSDTDEDWLVLAQDSHTLSLLLDQLALAGFQWEGDTEHYQETTKDGFMSWRKGALNLIVTKSESFWERHRAATHVCKMLNLADKQHRIAVFQAVLYGRKWKQKAA
jgi:hypothetical protein